MHHQKSQSFPPKAALRSGLFNLTRSLRRVSYFQGTFHVIGFHTRRCARKLRKGTARRHVSISRKEALGGDLLVVDITRACRTSRSRYRRHVRTCRSVFCIGILHSFIVQSRLGRLVRLTLEDVPRSDICCVVSW